MRDPRICAIGAGNLSSRAIYPYIGKAEAQLVGVCDLDREKAETNARRYGGAVYTDFREMLEKEKPDGVIICTGPEGHQTLAPEVMKLGFPVYTEKPPSATAAEALKVARVSKETGLLCSTAFKKRYAECNQRAKQFIEEHEADLLSISVDCGFGGYDVADKHAFLFDFCIHAIDLIGFLGGEISELFCFAKGNMAYAVSLRFASGAVGAMHLSRGYGGIPKEELEISTLTGDSMSIHNSNSWKIGKGWAGTEWREPPTYISAGDSGNDTGHFAEIRDFVQAIQEKRTTRSNIFESYKSMVVYEAIIASAESGQIVRPVYEAL